MKHYEIKGDCDLARDPKTNSIININKFDYDQYVSKRNSRIEKNKKVESIEQEVASIKNDLNEIKSLLKEFIK
jgi:hypothetical protein